MSIPQFIQSKLNLKQKLHLLPNHPIEIIKKKIYSYLNDLHNYSFQMFDELDPIVTVEENFDKLLIPKSHPARSKSDTYYIDDSHVLRTQTSAHQNELLSKKIISFAVTGDVYRKDEINSTHYPIFHQMEILTIIEKDLDPVEELKKIILGLIIYLFGNCEYEFKPDYFPFTDPSFEVEINSQKLNKKIEILGCGVVQPEILKSNGFDNHKAIACGFGLDRLAMLLLEIPDIRILWVNHDRFLNQYSDGKMNIFKPYSTVPPQYRDISFYVPNIINSNIIKGKWAQESDFLDLIRNYNEIAEVECVESFYNEKLKKNSFLYKIKFAPCDPTIKNGAIFTECVNETMQKLQAILVEKLHVEIR